MASVLRAVACAVLLLAVNGLDLRLISKDSNLLIEPWGRDSLRVRIAMGAGGVDLDKPGALIKPGSDNKGWPTSTPGEVAVNARSIQNGHISASVGDDGSITFAKNGLPVLRESSRKLLAGTTTTASDVFFISINNSLAQCDGGPCCIGIDGFHMNDQAQINVSACSYVTDTYKYWTTHWSFDSAYLEGTSPTTTINILFDGKCLGADHKVGASVNTGEDVFCNRSDAVQQWSGLKPAKTVGEVAVGPLTSQVAGRCLAAVVPAGRMKGTLQNGDPVTLVACNASDPLQQWSVLSAPARIAAVDPVPRPKVEVRFEKMLKEEKIFGFGEHRQGHLDLTGQVWCTDLLHCVSCRYGVLYSYTVYPAGMVYCTPTLCILQVWCTVLTSYPVYPAGVRHGKLS
jgi:hypothetical protein